MKGCGEANYYLMSSYSSSSDQWMGVSLSVFVRQLIYESGFQIGWPPPRYRHEAVLS